MQKTIVFITLILTFMVVSSFNPEKVCKYKMKTIVIDPGHGGNDPGTLGKSSKEKDIALAVSLELGRIIQKNLPGIKVVYTRSSDKFVELYKRAEIANKNQADLMISIHCNAVPKKGNNWQSVHGTEIYIMGNHKSEENLEVARRENAVIFDEANYKTNYDGFDPNSPESNILLSLSQEVHVKNSLNLASKMDNQFETRVKRKSRGVKQAGFVVLAKTALPSVLVELGFLSNLEEEKFLKDAMGQVYMASAIFRAIREYKEELE